MQAQERATPFFRAWPPYVLAKRRTNFATSKEFRTSEVLGGTAGHSSKNRYCPARFGTVDRYAFSTGQLSTLAVVRDVYYSQLWVMYTRAVQGISCAAGPCVSQGLARILYAWSCPLPSCRAGKVWWVIAKQHTYRDFKLKWGGEIPFHIFGRTYTRLQILGHMRTTL